MSLKLDSQALYQMADTPVRNRTIYVSGPMRGIEDFNFPAFDAARDFLEDRGWMVYSPADLDRQQAIPAEDLKFEECMRRDYAVIARSGAIALLPGWEQSVGANAELRAAKTMGLEVYLLDPAAGTMQPYDAEPRDPGEDTALNIARALGVMTARRVHRGEMSPWAGDEVRVKDAATGGEKGQKLARFDLIPPDALAELAKVYGVGSLKYEDRNWERGYRHGLSFGAMQRHAWLDWNGETFDSEMSEAAGQPIFHMAAVAWHALAQIAFHLRNAGTNDRGPQAKP